MSHRIEWRPGGRGRPKESVTFSERDYPRGAAARNARRACQLVDAHNRDITREDVYRLILGVTPEPEPTGPLLDAWFQTWAARKVNIEPGTLSTYRRRWAQRISPAFGDAPVDAITREDVRTWVSDLSTAVSSRGGILSAQTVHRYHALLHQVLKDATTAGLVAVNVAAGSELPNPRHGVTQEERVFLTHAQAAALLAGFTSVKARDLVTVLLGTGLRWSEAAALQTRDVERGAAPARITVRRAWKVDGTRRYLGAPKSQKSRRVVTIDTDVLAARVRAHGVPAGAPASVR